MAKDAAPDPRDFIRDPYVLEFLGAPAVPALYEKDLEQGLLDQLQTFLLELGKGFAFVARQKHLRVEGEDCFIDLVFYNYLLKCFVLIDLKTGPLTHQDVGQMDMYVRMYDELRRGGQGDEEKGEEQEHESHGRRLAKNAASLTAEAGGRNLRAAVFRPKFSSGETQCVFAPS